METQKVDIPWNDGSKDKITLTFSENQEGIIEVNIQSPQPDSHGRVKVLRFLTDSSNSVDIELDQTNTEVIGTMAIGINFIVR